MIGVQPDPGSSPATESEGRVITIIEGPKAPQDAENKSGGHSLRFWLIIVALSLLAFICALDATIITTPLPTIIEDIGGQAQYVWVANSFVFAAAVLQPFFGQLADILGRRAPIVACLVLFIAGSAIAGSSGSPAQFIAGRTIQGAGAGGIYVLIDVVCCDLVPLRDRGKYLGIVNAWAGVASAVGPVIGGVLGQASWPWIFYMNIPICILPLSVILVFMKEKKRSAADLSKTGASRMSQLDFLGNIIFIPSMVSLLIGLGTGGIQHPWSSWTIIVPLVLGGVGWMIFHVQQHFARSPSIPERLFSNRTSAAAYALSFIASVIAQAALYFIPVYLQAVIGANVLLSGVYFLPTATGILLSAMIAGVTLSKTGSYRTIHAVAFALSAVGFGLFTLLGAQTPTVAWVFFQLITAAGAGMPISTLLPAIMVALPESDVASATATFSFIKTFGYIWGVTIPSIIFSSIFSDRLYLISDPHLQQELRGGGAYSAASQAHLLRASVDQETWAEAAQVYTISLKAIWWFCLVLSLLGLVIVWFEKQLELRTELSTEFGLDEGTEAEGREKVAA